MEQQNLVKLRAVKHGDSGIALEFTGVTGDIGKYFAAQPDGGELPLEYVEAILRFYLTNSSGRQGVDPGGNAPVHALW
ncbi:MAG TPA: hypothetical protein VGB85_24535 [Nannocystis sp.]|jgi:hypothetical protein